MTLSEYMEVQDNVTVALDDGTIIAGDGYGGGVPDELGNIEVEYINPDGVAYLDTSDLFTVAEHVDGLRGKVEIYSVLPDCMPGACAEYRGSADEVPAYFYSRKVVDESRVYFSDYTFLAIL